MQLRAGIDIGTNTILLLIARVEEGEIREVLEDHVTVVRLGQGVDKNHAFHPEALERARRCFASYAEILKKYPGIDVRAAATSGSRDARNSAEFFAEVHARYGIPVRVISGEEEALLSFNGALPASNSKKTMGVLDIGGGSTEIVGLRGSDLFRISFNMGCVRMTERFIKGDPPAISELDALREFVVQEFTSQAEIFAQLKEKDLVGVAGTATYLASADLGLSRFDPEKVHGHCLTLKNIELLISKFSHMTTSERLGIGGMDKGRADVIVAGAIILEEVLRFADKKEISTSVRGLRYGLVL